MVFDAPTVLILLLLANTAAALLLGAKAIGSSRLGAAPFACLGYWALSALLLVAGTALFGASYTLDPMISQTLAFSVILVALTVRLKAIFSNLAKPTGFWLLSVGALSCTVLLLANLMDLSGAEITTIGASLAILIVLATSTVCFAIRPTGQKANKTASIFLLVEALALSLPIITSIFPDSRSVLDPGLAAQLAVLALHLSCFVSGLLLLDSTLEKKRHEQKTENEVDPHTGLPTPANLAKLCSRALQDHRSQKTGYSLIALEMDGLEKAREKYGTALSDHLMKLLGHLCARSAGRQAFTGRLEGPVFAIFMIELSQEAAALMAHRIGRQLSQEVRAVAGKKLKIGTRAGVFTGSSRTPFSKAVDLAQGCLIDARLSRTRDIILWDDSKRGEPKRATFRKDMAPQKQKAA